MSPRAAWRLESLGFTRVYDYVPGKKDWFAAGLPREGRRAGTRRAGDVAPRDAVTCRLGDRVGDVATRARAAGQQSCLVLNEREVVLGRLREEVLDGDPEARVEDVMEPGPTTTRPDIEADALIERLRARRVPSIVITTSDGRLVGTFRAEGPAPEPPEETDCCLCSD